MIASRTSGARTRRRGLSRLASSVLEKSERVICVACCHELDGRSELVERIGRAIAQRGIRTLIVDADHLEPEMHSHFGTPATPGLAQMLAGDLVEESSGPHEVASDVWLLPAGLRKASPVAFAEIAEMGEAVEHLAAEFEAIVIVAPPLLSDVAGAKACSCAGATVLAVRKGVTRKEEAARALELIRQSGSSPRGVVILE